MYNKSKNVKVMFFEILKVNIKREKCTYNFKSQLDLIIPYTIIDNH